MHDPIIQIFKIVSHRYNSGRQCLPILLWPKTGYILPGKERHFES